MKVSKLKLQLAMARACMTVRGISKKCGVSSRILAEWGSKELSPKIIGKVAKALDIPVEDLLDM